MKKWISSFLTVLLCLFSLNPFPVFAAETYSLTVNVTVDEKVVAGVPVNLYCIADGNVQTYELTDDFLAFAADLEGLTLQTNAQVEATAKKLESYIDEFNVEPTYMVNSDQNGQAIFENLDEGLYYIASTEFDYSETTYSTETFVFWLNSDTTAKPKATPQGTPDDGEVPGNPGQNPGGGTDIDGSEGKDPETSKPTGPGVNTPTTGGSSNSNTSSGSNSSTGSSGLDIGNGTNDPLFSLPVNTAAESNVTFYLTMFIGGLAILGGIIFLMKRKQNQA